MRELSKNSVIVEFVLKTLPYDQIKKYYVHVENCSVEDITSQQICFDTLVSRITRLDFNRQGYGNNSDNTRRQQNKALVSLYLTVLYLIVKNLVNVNSRYVIACSALERDTFLHNINKRKLGTGLTTHFIDKNWLNNIDYLKSNIELGTYNQSGREDSLYIQYRNAISHLNAISSASEHLQDIKKVSSYFAMYHYIIQKHLNQKFIYELKEEYIPNEIQEYLTMILNHKTYCKDLVKILNTPFAYNRARYNNLSIEKLFDRNNC